MLDSRQLSLKMQIMQNMSLKCARFECNENISVIPLELTFSVLLSFIWSVTCCDVILSSRHSERRNSRHGWLVPESHYVRVMLASFRDAGTTKELAQWWSSFGIYQNPWPQDKALILISLLVGKTHLTYIFHCPDFQYSRSSQWIQFARQQM